MKVLVKENRGRGVQPWKIREHTSENGRAFLWETYGKLDFRVVKKTGEVEFPPSQWSQFNETVITTEQEWDNYHAPPSYELGRKVQDCRNAAILRKIAYLLGIEYQVPPFPLNEESASSQVSPQSYQ